ncbi:hypothetical protein [Ensifer aridi]|uniref:hypothetical protein n=1 Tax=Ensifer aridi TaxID=1708715 RepID=UPI00111C5DE5|nr:hypothetical protein [Ensifer aridi]
MAHLREHVSVAATGLADGGRSVSPGMKRRMLLLAFSTTPFCWRTPSVSLSEAKPHQKIRQVPSARNAD